MKCRKALVSEEQLLVRDKVRKASKNSSETREQTLHRQEEQNQTHDKHKHLSSSLCVRSNRSTN